MKYGANKCVGFQLTFPWSAILHSDKQKSINFTVAVKGVYLNKIFVWEPVANC